MICEHCQSDAGRYNMQNECCKLRHYAKMPETRRNGFDTWYASVYGKDALEEMKARARVEWKRLKGLKC